MTTIPEIPKWLLNSLNNIYQLKLKAKRKGFYDEIERDLVKLKENFADGGLIIHDPLGEKCPDTRTDVEVNIAGEGGENLVIIDVIKPIIRQGTSGLTINQSTVVQKGIVVAEQQN